MWHRAFVVSGLVFLAACPSKNDAERATKVVIQQFELFANRMCGCKDKVCADKVQEDLTAWSTEQASKNNDNMRPASKELMKEMTDIGQRYGECMTRALSNPYAVQGGGG